MTKKLHQLTLLLFFSVATVSALPVWGRGASVTITDEEYDRYKKRGDDYFKEGKYTEARRQYQNCLEVPGFENDKYAKDQIQECTTGLALRQQAEDAMRQGKSQQAVDLLGQLLNLNPDDTITKTQFADYYERQGNQLFNQKKYLEAKRNYSEATKYASETKKETLGIQLRTTDELLRPKYPKRVGLKVATGIVAVGAGAFALLLRSDYQSKLSTLNQISQSADPGGTGIIDNPNTYRQYNDAYSAVESAQQKQGLFTACIGVAAVATLAEAYLLIHKPKPRPHALNWHPSTQSWGLAIRYTF